MTFQHNRETWLHAATLAIGEWFSAAGYTVPKNTRCAIGFPSTGRKSNRVGECWSPEVSADNHHEIFIRIDQADPVKILAILVHELVHAAVGGKNGHNAVFKKCANKLGLAGKMTATHAGPELERDLKKLSKQLGPLPHGALHWQENRKKQTTRMVKAKCADCGYTVRLTQKWIEEVGAPHCPNHGEMWVEVKDED